MLEIRHLTKRFNGIPVVEDVSFNIRPGEILGYVGANGAGLIPAYGLARLMASAVGDSAPRNPFALVGIPLVLGDRKSTRLNSSH